MFSISFGEIVAVAVIGLIVIGPRRLPETARFLGHLASRVQRQVAGVKADIRREMDLEDLKSIQREYEGAARDIKDGFHSQARELQNAASVAEDELRIKDGGEERAATNRATQWPGGAAAAEDTKDAEDEKDGARTKNAEDNTPSAERGAGDSSAGR